ncbi:hypothetical protein [Herbidospora sp. NBRC 101105]|uniref:hypothetical protein n=1 Tax=Herbidospora sp. NBRC 101105 TaxID=3032195 RepID=UPI0024A12175|nr:hypothetical protein [Herbidospora sp. NBRC 101105]GLX98166.1 hypothetical protein Hesp01_61160 [Herbidospora sp. NBRC 101105]
MDERRVWPPTDDADDLPPSARWYGTPAPPPRRIPRRLRRLLLIALVSLGAGAVIGGVVFFVLNRPEAPVETVAETVLVTDRLAGLTYPIPAGWHEGALAPVTGFTSVAVNDDRATVMARPGDKLDAADPRPALLKLAETYSRLLLHGDTIDVVEDKKVEIGGRTGHTRAVRAGYRDVVNQPAFLRVTVLTAEEGRSVVMLGLAHPDDPAARREIDTIMTGAR